MERDPMSTGEYDDAIGRAAIYRLVADSLVFPTEASYRQLRAEVLPIASRLRTGIPELDAALALAVEAQDLPLKELRAAQIRAFPHIESTDCPAYESAYCPGDIFRQAKLMADVSAFYRAHGVRVGGRRRERPDHIATELEFMSFMARKEAYALVHLGVEQVNECEQTARHFLRDHLGCWAPAFAARLAIVADHGFFVAVAGLLEQWIAADLEWLGVEPANSWVEPQPMPAPDDGACAIGAVADLGTPVDLHRR